MAKGKSGRPAGQKRTVQVVIKLTPAEAELLYQAGELVAMGPTVFSRVATVARARRVLAEENGVALVR